jgi:hypothetical protein
MITASAAGGNWSSTAAWTGGVVPGAGDDVLLTVTSGNITIDTSAAACNSLNCTGYTGTLTHVAGITFNIGSAAAGLSSDALVLVAGMTYTLGNATTSALNFISTSATQLNVTSGGNALGNVTFNGAGGSWILTDGFSTNAAATVTLTAGTLNTNSQACSWGLFSSSNSNTRVLTMGTSAITLTGTGTTWNIAIATGLTLSAASSTINVTGATASFSHANSAGSAGSFGTLNLTGSGVCQYLGQSATGNSFVNFNRTGTAVKTDSLSIVEKFAVTGTLTLAGNSVTNRLLVQSSVTGTALTITAAAVSLTDVDFQDITGAGAASWAGTSIGDCGGNSNITVTAALNLYGVNTSANSNWSTALWATSSGGSSGARVPLPQDAVYLDGNSGTHQYAIDMPRLCANLICLGFTGALYASATNFTMYGSLTLVAGMTYTNNVSMTLSGRGSGNTITSAGHTHASIGMGGVGGTYTLQDNLTVTQTFTISYIFNANGMNVSAGEVQFFGGAATTVNMGSGTWTCTGTTTIWNYSSGIINPQTSTIVLAGSGAAITFAGGTETYGNITIQGLAGGSVTFTGNSTFGTFTCTQKKTLIFPASTTLTAAQWVLQGSSGNLVTLQSSSSGTTASIKQTSGYVFAQFVSLKDSTATGGAAFGYDSNSTVVSNVAGWALMDLETGTGSFSFSGSGTETLSQSGAGTYSFSGNSTISLVSAGGGAYSFTGTASEALTVAGGGLYSYSGSGAGVIKIAGTGVGHYSFTGTATDSLASSGVGSYSFVGHSAESLVASGNGSYRFTGTATGAVTAVIVATPITTGHTRAQSQSGSATMSTTATGNASSGRTGVSKVPAAVTGSAGSGRTGIPKVLGPNW